ncbi:MAG TPA: hypothetical protein VMU95_24720 [Trebonia sp.]|nr:hypothetical protein [Trebonia sp.]
MTETGPGERPAWPEAVPESVRTAIEGVPVDIGPGPVEAEGRIFSGSGPDVVRQVVAAWVTAVNGDESALRALAELARSDLGAADDGHAAAYDLLHPVRKDWMIAPGPEVAGIELLRLDLSGDAPELSVRWRFTGSQKYGGPVIPPGWTGSRDHDYVGLADLTFDESRPFPWRMTHGHVETLDDYYGYTFTSRDETPEEYQARSEPAVVSRAALVPGGTYRLVASFAEHDHRFGGEATSDVDSDVPLTRAEAQRLAEDAIAVEARQRMASMYPVDGGEMEARPSLNALLVTRLLEVAPAVGPVVRPDAAGLDGAGLDGAVLDGAGSDGQRLEGQRLDGRAVNDFARRYAASRDLTYCGDRNPLWHDPRPWFLASLDVTRTYGLTVGSVAGSPSGEVWYAQDAVRGRGGSRARWTVACFLLPQADRAGGIALAVRRRRLVRSGPRHRLPGGLPRGLTEVPRGLVEVPGGGVEDAGGSVQGPGGSVQGSGGSVQGSGGVVEGEQFGGRYVVAAAGETPADGGRPWANRLLSAEFRSWLMGQPYGEHGAEATCFQMQGGVVCVFAAGWPQTADALDAFRERAARIASAVRDVTRLVVQ